ncbi:MAG: hypothetical protein AAF657_00500 [Acidobacteriota bacterium]
MSDGTTAYRKRARCHGAAGAALAALLILVPCGALVEPAVASSTTQLAQQDFPAPVLSALETAFGAYENVRQDLAADRLSVLPASASALAGSLRLVLEDQEDSLAGKAPSVILEAALTAESLAGSGDLPAARQAFGEVSRLLMVLADGDPRLVEGWHVFACPMVKSYAKWMQPTAELENPYMGPAMPKCGFASDWSVPAPAAKPIVASVEKSSAEPEFKAGIPRLKMVDVRDHKFLWREIAELQIWERGERLTVREFRSKAIEKTAHYLELEGAEADEFVAAASEAVVQVREAFRANKPVVGNENRFAEELESVKTHLASLLQDRPRHHLFEPGFTKWLLKLALGPKAAKEAREAEESRQTGHAR